MTDKAHTQLQEKPEITWQYICSQINKARFIPEGRTFFGVKRTQYMQEQAKRNKDAR